MKHLLGIFSALLIILLIAACSDTPSSSEPEPQGQIIGSWEVFDTHANWVGTSNKPSATMSETQVFFSPDSNAIEIVGYEDGEFDLLVTDSTFSSDSWDSLGAQLVWTTPLVTNELSRSTDISFGVEEDFVTYRPNMSLTCDSTYNLGDERIYIDIIAEDSTSLRSYEFVVGGFISAIKNVSCD